MLNPIGPRHREVVQATVVQGNYNPGAPGNGGPGPERRASLQALGVSKPRWLQFEHVVGFPSLRSFGSRILLSPRPSRT